MKRTAYLLAGPTASGKSAIAATLAREMGAAILSADSMLVYRGMDIGTAKPPPEEIAEFSMGGVDLVSPAEEFSAGAWLRAAADWARVKKRPRPSTGELYGVETNLEIGCWYLARSLRRWSGYKERIALALAQYNAGESRAKAWAPEKRDGEVVPRIRIAATRKYVETILKRYRNYLGERPGTGRAGGK